MPFVVCPKHDYRFDTVTDHKFPGAVKKGEFGAPDVLLHPHNGHPDCKFCQQEAQQARTQSTPSQIGVRRVVA